MKKERVKEILSALLLVATIAILIALTV